MAQQIGGIIASETKKRGVLQLLKLPSLAFGLRGAAPLDEAANMTNTAYGPNGMVLAGTQFGKRDRARLAESYRHLEHALKMLKQQDFRAWMSLATPYLGDPGDPSVVAQHRRKADEGLCSARLFVDHHPA